MYLQKLIGPLLRVSNYRLESEKKEKIIELLLLIHKKKFKINQLAS